MKRNRGRHRGVPAGGADAAYLQAQIEDVRRTGTQFLIAAAFCVLLTPLFFVAGYRIGIDFALVAAWFCGTFGLAWRIAALALHLPFFARWTLRVQALPARFHPASGLAALLWFVLFIGGGIGLIRVFRL